MEEVGVKWFGTSKEKKGSSFMEMEKHMFGKQMFAGTCRNNESILDSASLGLGKFPTT